MINLQLWRRYIEGLATDSSLIKRSEIVATKERFLEKTKNLPAFDYPVLLSVIPDARPGTVNEDNVSEINIMLLFILTPIKRGDFEAEIEFDKWEQTANCCAELKTRLLEDYFRNYQYPFLQEIDFKSLMQQPVWNFEGYMGWCVSFAIEQGGFDFEGYTEEVFTYGEASWVITDRIGVSIDVFNETNVNHECLLFFRTNDSGYFIIQTTIPARTLITITQELPFNSNTNQILILDSTRTEIQRHTINKQPLVYGELVSSKLPDYGDGIVSRQIVTNNAEYPQTSTIKFRINNEGFYFYTHILMSGEIYEFTHEFTGVNIWVDNIVETQDGENTIIGENTLTASLLPPKNLFSNGLMYNIYTAMNPLIAPAGWHVPTPSEWNTLITYLGGSSIAGSAMKANRSVSSFNIHYGWSVYNSATNSSKLNVLPGAITSMGDPIIIYCNLLSNTTQAKRCTNNTTTVSNVNPAPLTMGGQIRLIRNNLTGWEEGEKITDIEGNEYETAKVGSQVWTTSSFCCTKLRDGSQIQKINDSATWANATYPAYIISSSYTDIEENGAILVDNLVFYEKYKRAKDIDDYLINFANSYKCENQLNNNRYLFIEAETGINRTSISDDAVDYLTELGFVIIINTW